MPLNEDCHPNGCDECEHSRTESWCALAIPKKGPPTEDYKIWMEGFWEGLNAGYAGSCQSRNSFRPFLRQSVRYMLINVCITPPHLYVSVYFPARVSILPSNSSSARHSARVK